VTVAEQEPAATSPAPAPARCRRCGRELYAAASVELGYGPDCARHLTRTVTDGRRRVRVLELPLPMDPEREPTMVLELPLEGPAAP
jgi:hypothetical protein